MNEARLRIIDKLLGKGWCSYLDIAQAIEQAVVSLSEKETNPYGLNSLKKEIEIKKSKLKPGETYTPYDSYNKRLLDKYRPIIGQDFMDIPEIWALVHEGRLLLRNGKKSSSEDRAFRTDVRNSLIEETVRNQYCAGEYGKLVEHNVTADPRKNTEGIIDLKRVKFYRYRQKKYSIFTSGDFKKYNDVKTRLKIKKKLAGVTETAVAEVDVRKVLYEEDVILEPAVSEKIKQRIRLQNELEEYEAEVKTIIEQLQSSITIIGEDKCRGWIKKTINFYKNILELAQSPLSNIDRRQLAGYIHDFALFLAIENRYDLLAERFEAAISIYQKLVLLQKHSIDDYLSKEEIFADEGFDPENAKQQLQRDKELVAESLLQFARVQFDSHNVDYALSILERAIDMSQNQSAVRARILHLRAVIYSFSSKFDLAETDLEESLRCATASHMEEREIASLLSSRAEMLRSKGRVSEALNIYDEVLRIYNKEDNCTEEIASALMNKAMLMLYNREPEDAVNSVDAALEIFHNLYSVEPDRIFPSLISSKYIKMLATAQRSDLLEAIECGEDIVRSFKNAGETLQTLSVPDVIQTILYLKELYGATGQWEKLSALENTLYEIIDRYKEIIPVLS